MMSTLKRIFSYLSAVPLQEKPTLKVARRIKNVPMVMIVPTHRPDKYTIRLIKSLVSFNKDLFIKIIVVNDCAPRESRALFTQIRSIDRKRVKVIATPRNTLKAGAINHALNYIRKNKMPAEIVFTMDDDVMIRRGTINAMAKQLLKNPHFGAVCSLAQVANKNKNFITRLQGLEYAQFNAIRIADDNYLAGPLVMHGMAAAFRMKAIKQVKGFAKNHLVEDYDITVRLKDAGWYVGLAPQARAYTVVPESMKVLWRQRTRWFTGGIQIVTTKHKAVSVFQDILGHILFLANFSLIWISLLFHRSTPSTEVSQVLLVTSLLLFGMSYIFSLIMLKYYIDRDWKDVIIRVLLIPELIYAFGMTLILIGTYLFHLNKIAKRVVLPDRVDWVTPLDRMFNKLGYSLNWGGN